MGLWAQNRSSPWPAQVRRFSLYLGPAEEAVDVLVELDAAQVAVVACDPHQQASVAHVDLDPVGVLVRKIEHAPVHRVLALHKKATQNGHVKREAPQDDTRVVSNR